MPRLGRLIRDGAARGAWNMGVDEALLATATRDGRATLRFYRWEGFWLSLGRGQRPDGRLADACRASGVGLVQRVTGGKAVLHGADLTYALAAPDTWFPRGLSATYQCVSGALASALSRLGVAVEPRCEGVQTPGTQAKGTHSKGTQRPGREAFDCFAHPADHELVVGGRKLVGSAQRRTRGGVLQHGSIRFESEPLAVRDATGLVPGTATSLREEGFQGTLVALEEACVGALSEALGARFERGELDPAERDRAQDRPDLSRLRPGGISRHLSGSR
jgi:lipoate-protein ligase A